MRDDETMGSPMPAGQGEIGALVHRAVEGDAQATHDLLARVHPLALRYCRTRLNRLPGDARHFVEDLAQEVCVAVLMALPRYSQPDEIAAMVAYLASPEAAFVTGTSLTIDGGFTA